MRVQNSSINTLQMYSKVNKGFGNTVIVPIKGLSSGVYTYDYTCEHSFFDQFGNQDVRDAHVEVHVVLEKEERWMRLIIVMNGTLLRSCDRCLGDVLTPVNYRASVVVKFAKSYGEEEGDELFLLEPAATQIDLTQYVYDSICVSLPIQSLHPLGQCDPEMERKLSQLTVNP